MRLARFGPGLVVILVACTSVRPGPLGEGSGDDGPDAASGVPDAGVDASPAEPRPKGDRTLGIVVRPDDLGFVEQVEAIRDAGAGSTNVAFAWDEVEQPADGADGGTTVFYHPFVHVAGLVLSSAGVSADAALVAVDGAGARLPADLAGRSLDDAEVAARYAAATDYVLEQLGDATVSVFLVGEGVDRAFGDDAARYDAFAVFVQRAAAHVHATSSRAIRVAFTVSAEGLGARAALLEGALAASDLVAVDHVGGAPLDLDALAAAAPAGRPVVVHAAGYPSAPDADAQVAFVRSTFQAWDRHADRIPRLTFFELDDPPEGATTFGLRRGGTGATKPAFGVLRSNARARGF